MLLLQTLFARCFRRFSWPTFAYPYHTLCSLADFMCFLFSHRMLTHFSRLPCSILFSHAMCAFLTFVWSIFPIRGFSHRTSLRSCTFLPQQHRPPFRSIVQLLGLVFCLAQRIHQFGILGTAARTELSLIHREECSDFPRRPQPKLLEQWRRLRSQSMHLGGGLWGEVLALIICYNVALIFCTNNLR